MCRESGGRPRSLGPALNPGVSSANDSVYAIVWADACERWVEGREMPVVAAGEEMVLVEDEKEGC